MKRLMLGMVLMSSLLSFGQVRFDTVIPPEPLGGMLHIDRDTLFVEGHWVALDEKSKLSGPSVSTINCYRKRGICEEEQANINMMEDQFTLTADHLEYRIERWTEKDIVASNVSGVCKVRHVIKVDVAEKRVYTSDTLSEPLDGNLPQLSKDMCKMNGLNLELKRTTMWKR